MLCAFDQSGEGALLVWFGTVTSRTELRGQYCAYFSLFFLFWT